MTREFLTLFVPLVLPTALYLLWLSITRWWQVGGTIEWQLLPWLWLIGAGVGLTALVLFVVTVHFGTSQRGTYVAPHLEDGRIVPGHIEPQR